MNFRYFLFVLLLLLLSVQKNSPNASSARIKKGQDAQSTPSCRGEYDVEFKIEERDGIMCVVKLIKAGHSKKMTVIWKAK